MPFRVNRRTVDALVRTPKSEARPGRGRGRNETTALAPRTRPVRPRRGWYLTSKTAAEWLSALLLFVVTLPLVLLAMLLIKLTSRGPALYTQMRVGRRGRLFTIYKLRTMIDRCESLTGPRWAIPGDPRITWIGQFLRQAHLDELPQLVNVLRGDMSLIGPRPERPEFFPELERALPLYRERLNVRPGVTGLAQVQLPADTDLFSVRSKLACDLFYVEHVSALLDLRILLCTLLYAVGVPFRMTRRFLGLAASEHLIEAVPMTSAAAARQSA